MKAAFAAAEWIIRERKCLDRNLIICMKKNVYAGGDRVRDKSLNKQIATRKNLR